MPYLKTQGQGLFKFCITVQCQIFDCSSEILQNLYFDSLHLLKKCIKFQLKKYRGHMPNDAEKWCRIRRKSDLLFQKWQEFGEFWSEHTKVSKTFALTGPFRARYVMFDLNRYRGVIFHDTEKSCKIWRKTYS